jgi:hypothetical protein
MRSRFCPLILLALLLAAPARATVVIATDLGELARGARAIARGRIAALDARWSPDHRMIETIVSLEVESYLKGSLGPILQFRVPGGLVGRYRSIVVGAPEFSVDQRVVVFLGGTGPSVPYVLGLSQGVFRVVPGEGGAGWVVTPPPLMPVATTTPIVRGDVSRRPVPLTDFEQRVRGLVARGQ